MRVGSGAVQVVGAMPSALHHSLCETSTSITGSQTACLLFLHGLAMPGLREGLSDVSPQKRHLKLRVNSIGSLQEEDQ